MTELSGDLPCAWCGQLPAVCRCDFDPVDECPPMCDCGGDDRERPEVTVMAQADATHALSRGSLTKIRPASMMCRRTQ
jgi:hypothetical protein